MEFIQNSINLQQIQMQEIGDSILSMDPLIHINAMNLGLRGNVHNFLNIGKV
jgi:hypothetical protein